MVTCMLIAIIVGIIVGEYEMPDVRGVSHAGPSGEM